MYFDDDSPYTEGSPVFSPDQFKAELKRGAEAIGVEYSEETTIAVLKAFDQNFHEGVVQLRAGSRPGEPLIYRIYPPRPIDSIGIAVNAGLFDADNPRVQLVKSWVDLYPAAYEQPDFSADKGLARAFIFFGVNNEGSLRPLDEILSAPNVPEPIKNNRNFFIAHGLAVVQAACVDYHSGQIYLYFVVQGPLTREKAALYASLAGAEPPSDFMYDEMSTMLGQGNFFLCCEMDYSGVITRVDFYIIFPIELPGGRMPELPERLHNFWDIDTFPDEELDILAWSFGKDVEQPCIQAERTYAGNLRELWRKWGIMSVE